MSELSLDTAKRIAEAAFAEAHARGIDNISVVVTDRGGDIRLAMRADAQGCFGIDTALGKARTALGFYRSSLALAAVFQSQPASSAAIASATGGRFVPIGGGILVCDSDGAIIGATAISGGLPQADHDIAVAAIRHTGLDTRD